MATTQISEQLTHGGIIARKWHTYLIFLFWSKLDNLFQVVFLINTFGQKYNLPNTAYLEKAEYVNGIVRIVDSSITEEPPSFKQWCVILQNVVLS